MTRRLLVLAAVGCALSVAPAHADPIPPNLRPKVTHNVDPNRPYAGVGVWVGNYPLLGANVDGERGRACAGWGYTTGICTDQVIEIGPAISDLPPPL